MRKVRYERDRWREACNGGKGWIIHETKIKKKSVRKEGFFFIGEMRSEERKARELRKI